MKLLNHTEKYTNREPLSNAEKTIRLKARLSLIVVWSSALAVCLLFVYFTFAAVPSQPFATNSSLLVKLQNNLLVNDSIQSNKNNPLLPGDNDAFVFVNINRQFFLTRFPSGRQDDAADTLVNSNGQAKTVPMDATETGSVIRKAKTKKKKATAEDFSIKPVPR